MIRIFESSPSNIKTGWGQKYFFKVEMDAVLNSFIKVFQKNGNRWNMKSAEFDLLIEREGINRHPYYKEVAVKVLASEGGYIHLRPEVIDYLLKCNRKFSFRHFWRKQRNGPEDE